MILLLAVALVAVGLGYLLGGRLRRFELLHLRWWALAPVGLVLQLIPIPELAGDRERLLGVGLLIASYVLLLAFTAVNLRIAGFPLLLLGLALNSIVITANGGMPVSRNALVESHQQGSLERLARGDGAKHHLLGSDDVLTPLADVIAVGPPIDEIMSVGDILVYIALLWLVVAVMRGRTRGLALEAGRPPYLGRHRRGRSRTRTEAPPIPTPPPSAGQSGTGP